MNFKFPENFYWGAASAAFQAEGATHEGGKCLNIREYCFYHPEYNKRWQDQYGPEVVDFYHRYNEDLDLFKELGMNMFRFSIQWSRIQPEKGGPINQEGVDYYNDLINQMLARGITPFMDLWHSDLPVWAYDNGGLTNPEFIDMFVSYAEVCFREFGDRVKFWSTVNEPKLNVYGAYAFGHGYPYMNDVAAGIQATHNVIIAHYRCVKLLRKLWPDAKIGSVHNTGECYCRSFEEEDIAAARRHWAMQLVFSDPMILGKYPDEMMEFEGMRKYVTDEMLKQLEEEFIPMDFMGCNNYCPTHARFGNDEKSTSYGTKGFPVPDLEPDAYGFRNYGPALFDILMNFKDRYNNIMIFVTENGYTDRREDMESDNLHEYQHDIKRELYIREHIRNCGRAIRAGVNLAGYLYWSATDVWESSKGYGYPMGLIAIDLKDGKRIPRDSYYYYQKVIKNNMVD